MTKLEKRFLNLIKAFNKRYGWYPSLSELARKQGCHKSLAHKYVKRLEAKGKLTLHARRGNIISTLSFSPI